MPDPSTELRETGGSQGGHCLASLDESARFRFSEELVSFNDKPLRKTLIISLYFLKSCTHMHTHIHIHAQTHRHTCAQTHRQRYTHKDMFTYEPQNKHP